MKFLYEDTYEQEEIRWLVTYYLPNLVPEFDDSMEDDVRKTVVVEATDIDMAAKYAQQYIITKQKSQEASDWEGAEILSIERT